LRPIDGGHTYLRQRGISSHTAALLGAGYYGGPGLMYGRVVMPIRDERRRRVTTRPNAAQCYSFNTRSPSPGNPAWKDTDEES